MADNLKYNEPGDGPLVATDELPNGSHAQIVKLDIGPPNESIPLTGSINGIPVTIAAQIQAMIAASGTVSTANSSTATLTANSVFTGVAEDTLNWSGIAINLIASASGQTSGMAVQFSSDATNWDIVELYSIRASTPYSLRILPKARFFRLVYQNGATAQGSFRLQTIYKTHFIPDNVDANERLLINGISYQVKQSGINATSLGDNTVVAAVTGKRIRVVAIAFTASANVDVAHKSGASNTLISAMPVAKYGGIGLNFMPHGFLCETNAGEAYVLNLSGTCNVRGTVNYVEL